MTCAFCSDDASTLLTVSKRQNKSLTKAITEAKKTWYNINVEYY